MHEQLNVLRILCTIPSYNNCCMTIIFKFMGDLNNNTGEVYLLDEGDRL